MVVAPAAAPRVPSAEFPMPNAPPIRPLRWLVALLLAAPGAALAAQDTLPAVFPDDARYYDFWPGTWHRVVNGRPDTGSTTFRVRRDVHEAAFVEEWRLRVDSTRMRATAIRAWDKTAGRWMYTWVSDNALYQVWEGRKFGDDWYIVRHFDIAGDRYLSRQAWIPVGPDRLVRVSEKSYDEGRTWELRFREEYARAAP
jgi:hypothetical protein